MNRILRNLTLCAFLGVSLCAHAAPVFFPNGDFEADPVNTDWGQSLDGNHVFSYPATGGNPGGYASIVSNDPGGNAVLISNNNQPYPLTRLGLAAGNTYAFSYDMIASVAGADKGGVKVESWTTTAAISDSGNQRVTAASTGWTTYTYDYAIAPTATHIKFVPLWTPNETVGFDNIKVNNTPVPPPPFVPEEIPNGNFETAGGAGWTTETVGPVISFPTTEGNPAGNATIDATVNDNFAAIKAFNGVEKSFASLGLSPGDQFTIQLDMKILEGSSIGGVRLVGPAGYQFLSRPAIIDGGTEWATYSIPVTVPAASSQVLITLVWGFNSKVAFDNVQILLPAPTAALQATATIGTKVGWTTASATNSYQPQESSDGSNWSDLGPLIIGNTVTSIFDASKSPFYQVLESTSSTQESVYNGGFEESSIDDITAANWLQLGFTGPDADTAQAPQRSLTEARTGDACMQLKIQNAATDALSGKSLIQHNTVLRPEPVDGEITPGNTYTFSFWAKQIDSGVSYVQQYKFAFLDSNGGIVGTTGEQNFAAGPAWTQITRPGLVAPEGAFSALIEIVGLTGAVNNGSGEVLIDDVSLTSSVFDTPTVLVPAPVVTPTVEISWPSATGQKYQVESSVDLGTWLNFGGVIIGNGSINAVYDTVIDKEFFRVGELP